MPRCRVPVVDAHAETRAAPALAFSGLGCSALSAAILAQGLAPLGTGPDCLAPISSLPDGGAILRNVREGRSERVAPDSAAGGRSRSTRCGAAVDIPTRGPC